MVGSWVSQQEPWNSHVPQFQSHSHSRRDRPETSTIYKMKPEYFCKMGDLWEQRTVLVFIGPTSGTTGSGVHLTVFSSERIGTDVQHLCRRRSLSQSISVWTTTLTRSVDWTSFQDSHTYWCADQRLFVNSCRDSQESLWTTAAKRTVTLCRCSDHFNSHKNSNPGFRWWETLFK